MNRPTPALHLEQQRFGERAVSADDALACAALTAADAAHLLRVPPIMFAARVRAELDRPSSKSRSSKSSSSSSSSSRWLWLAGPVAVAAALFVVIVPDSVNTDRLVPLVDDTRLKGLMPALDLQQQVGATTTTLHAGDVVGAGDIVQIRTRAAGAKNGVVVSIDGRGAVTRHFPDDDSTALPTGTASLPFSFELDDAPGFERFFFVTANTPIDVAAVERTIAGLAVSSSPVTAKPDLPAGLSWTDFLLRKR